MAVVRIERNNTLDVLRLISAVFVILHHSYPLTGNSSLLSTLGAIGVSTFFIISGYLISQSWFSDPSPSRFLWKRILRIVPGLIALSIFTIIFIGPINTNLSMREYFFNTATWKYLTTTFIFMGGQSLPGVFISNPYPLDINGSLWTIPVEFRMYILLCIIGVIGILKNRKVFPSIVLLSCLIYFNTLLSNIWLLNIITHALETIGISGYLYPLISNGIPSGYPAYNILFFIGALFYLYRDKINFNNWIPFGASIGLLGATFLGNPFFSIALLVCLPYFVLYLGQLPVKQLYNSGERYGDYSYGLTFMHFQCNRQ